MGIFHDQFHKQVRQIWDLAHQIEKPIHPDLTWTCGLIHGKGDFHDLQTHGMALAASIIIHSKVVPRIFIAWDTPVEFDTLVESGRARRKYYPAHLMRGFDAFNESMVKDAKPPFACYKLQSPYVTLQRSSRSINTWPWGLGRGYRAKHLGMQYVMTRHAIVSDIDTICVAPCIEYLDEQIAIDPDTFCITNWYNSRFLSVGLCVYNVEKYRGTYLPLLNRDYWTSWRVDSSFVQFVRNNHPEYADTLDLRIMDKNKISAERFSRSKARKNDWTPGTMFYHAWKGEAVKDPEGFTSYYQQILNDLEDEALVA